MATRKICKSDGCRRRFTPRRGTRREYCYECRPERTQAAAEAPADVQQAAPRRLDGPMAVVVRAELERAGQLETVTGGVALRLASALDDPNLGAAQVASISTKLLAVMEPLARLGPQVPDEVDEFTRRLAEKRASA
jgi:hypothetical protein